MPRNREISNTDDLIDSRQVIERIKELEGKRDAHGDLGPTDKNGTILPWASEFPDEAAELAALLALQSEAEPCAADWHHGETLIRDSYFTEYAQELAEDIGAIDSDAKWPLYCIDWERAARDLRMDYTSVEFDGVTYWVR